ncbi:MAG: helix-turn-helix transcriptional regulator [Chloroflexi bacterium]|nr:helix-turn-helix transcriptional regulator [Chloroflexota bacterium]
MEICRGPRLVLGRHRRDRPESRDPDFIRRTQGFQNVRARHDRLRPCPVEHPADGNGVAIAGDHLVDIGVEIDQHQIDQSTLSRIENGERIVTDVEVLAVCQALGVGVAELYSGVKPPAD